MLVAKTSKNPHYNSLHAKYTLHSLRLYLATRLTFRHITKRREKQYTRLDLTEFIACVNAIRTEMLCSKELLIALCVAWAFIQSSGIYWVNVRIVASGQLRGQRLWSIQWKLMSAFKTVCFVRARCRYPHQSPSSEILTDTHTHTHTHHTLSLIHISEPTRQP